MNSEMPHRNEDERHLCTLDQQLRVLQSRHEVAQRSLPHRVRRADAHTQRDEDYRGRLHAVRILCEAPAP
jgi:hypothetical protein